MLMFLAIGSEFSPPGIDDFFGYYDSGYQAALGAIEALAYSEGLVNQWIRQTETFCSQQAKDLADCTIQQAEKRLRNANNAR